METEVNQQPIAKPCPFCAEPINQTAKKCIHCGEYLDKHWTGFSFDIC
jgi:hypothetical protein